MNGSPRLQDRKPEHRRDGGGGGKRKYRHYGKYDTNTFRYKISVDMVAVKEEQSQYRDLPRFYTFGTPDEREKFLMEHLQGVYRDVEGMVGL